MRFRTGVLAAAGLGFLLTGQTALAQERGGAERVTVEALLAEAGAGAGYDGCLREAALKRAELGPIDPEGAPAEPPATRRLVLAIDASGSMAARSGATTKMEAAQRATRAFLAQVPPDVEVGVVAFGHKGSNEEAGKPESCAGVEDVSAPRVGDRDFVADAVDGLRATGWTPLAKGIEQAGAMMTFSEVPGEQVVWVVSDGVETCGGDPVAAARALHEGGTRAVVNIIGFDIPAAERAALEAVATAGGGVFQEARTGSELEARLQATRRRTQTMMNEAKATSRKALNTLAVTTAIVRTRSCFRTRMTQETTRLTALTTRARLGGTADDVVLDEADALLEAKHEAAGELLDAYEAAWERADAQLAAEIEDDLRARLEGAAARDP